MVYETIVALRYLGSRKKNHFISVISVISCVGVAIGVWALIVVISVMAGFEGDLRGKILETYAHLLVDKPKGNIGAWEGLLGPLEQVKHVQGASPFLRSEVMISSTVNLAGVTFKGVDTGRAGVVNRLKDSLVEGELSLLDHPERIPVPSFSSFRLAPGGVGSGLVPARQKDGSPDAGRPPAEGGDGSDAGEPAGSGTGSPGGGGGGEPEREQGQAQVQPRVQAVAQPQEQVPAGSELMPPLRLPSTDEAPRVLPGVLIGSELKKSLLVLVGDEVSIVSPLGDLGPSGPIPRSRTFRVAGVFYTGMYEYDSKMVYVTLPQAQEFLGLGNEITGIELRVDDPDASDTVSGDVTARLGAQRLRVRDWKTLNSSLFAALRLEKVAMFVILTLVTIVASFNIVASLIMVVLEKKKEVAILKALGTSDRGIARIFMTEGVLIGTIGMIFGVLAGVATCLVIATFGIPLDQEVYYINRLPVELHALDVSLIAASAVLISFLATLYPSRLAARLLPAEGLRHE